MILHKIQIIYIIVVLFTFSLLSCNFNSKDTHSSNHTDINDIVLYDSVYHKVLSEEKIRVITHNNSTGYFVYRGTPMGYHYDLIKLFAKKHDLSIEIVVEENLKRAIEMLDNNEVDVCTFDITETRKRAKSFLFTHPIGYNRQVLVQRKKYGKKKNDKSAFINSFLDIEHRKVYVAKGTIFKQQIIHLEEISNTDIEIIEDSIHTMEELIQLVSEGVIDYTACDERIAKANSTYVNNIDYSLFLSINQKLGWACALGSDSLVKMINDWLIPFSKTTKFAVINNKYFRAKKHSFYTKTDYAPLRGGSLSPYDALIKKYANQIGWDWRLLTAVVYQESRFNPSAGSWVGAQGLMQLIPSVATKFGVTDPTNPEQSLRAGAKYLQMLQKRFERDSTISDIDQIKFTLASYNVGYGHVVDARKLAEKHQGHNNVWTQNVDTFILLKMKPSYYNDPVVKYGYCRGSEPYKYVERIMSLYNDYKNVVDL